MMQLPPVKPVQTPQQIGLCDGGDTLGREEGLSHGGQHKYGSGVTP